MRPRSKLLLVLARLAFAVARRRHWVLATTVAVLVGALALGRGLFVRLGYAVFDDPGAEATQAAALARRLFGDEDPDVVALWRLEDRTGGVRGFDDAALRAALGRSLAAVARDASVAQIRSPLTTGARGFVSADRRSAFAVVSLRGTPQAKAKALTRLEPRLVLTVPGAGPAGAAATTRVRPLLGGLVPTGRALTQLAQRSLARGERVALPVTAVLLVLLFGSVVAALVPVALGMAAIVLALGLLALLARVMSIDAFAINVVTILGLGVAIDYALFLVSRYREERRREPDRDLALATAVGTAGRAVLFSGLTVAASLAGLFVFGQPFLRSVAVGGMAVVLLAAALALVVLPALLAALGDRLERGRVRWPARWSAHWAARRRQPAYRREHAPTASAEAGEAASSFSISAHRVDASERTGSRPARSDNDVVRVPGVRSQDGPDRADRTRRARDARSAALDGGAARAGSVHGDDDDRVEHAWRQVATAVLRHPLPICIAATCGLVLLALPFARLQPSRSDVRALPADSEPRHVIDRLGRDFPATSLTPISLVVTLADEVADDEQLAALYDYTRRVARLPSVERVDSLLSYAGVRSRAQAASLSPLVDYLMRHPNSARGQALRSIAHDRATLVRVITTAPPDSADGQRLVTRLRATRPPPGGSVRVFGQAAGLHDFAGRVQARTPWMMVIVGVAMFAVLLVAFQSLVLPIKAMLMTTLSLTASFGALVFIFQEGRLQSLLHYHALGTTDATLPVIMFAVVFGLSMDYEVLIIGRIREAWLRTGDTRGAIATGLARSGRLVTSAALLMIVVFSAFAAAPVVFIKALGLGMALAVALDASIVRLLLVPSTMALLGRFNWWLPHRPRRLPAPRAPTSVSPI